MVLGWTIFKQFDFENLKFEKPALAIIYINVANVCLLSC
jgi:hypothetical protein